MSHSIPFDCGFYVCEMEQSVWYVCNRNQKSACHTPLMRCERPEGIRKLL